MGPTVRGSTAETSKQNIFIHEFLQPKHASNPRELTAQNGSQAGGGRSAQFKGRRSQALLSVAQ